MRVELLRNILLEKTNFLYASGDRVKLVSKFHVRFFTLFLALVFCYSSMKAQCDSEVSGVFAYCNSFVGNHQLPGFFIGFRVKSIMGDTLNVIDLTGNVPMNLGKRINDINTQVEPGDTSRIPVRIAGGPDSLEFWYFGPFTDGDSFNIVLVDPAGVCDTIFVASGTFTCQGQDPTACDNDVPLYIMDFSDSNFNTGGGGGGNENVDDVFLVMTRQRVADCCFTYAPNERCFEFIITMDENDVGLIVDDVGSGSTGGKIYADSLHNFACGPDQNSTWPWFQDNGQSSDVEPICLVGSARDWIVLTCKQGGNATNASIGTVGTPYVNPEYVYSDCEVQMEVVDGASSIWSSPDDPNLDNLINFDPNHIVATFHYDEDVFGPLTSCEGDTFTYYVKSLPNHTCLPQNVYFYDTTFVVVYPAFSVDIHSTCSGVDSTLLEAILSSDAPTCDYSYEWSTGETSQSIMVSNDAAEYSVTITSEDVPSYVYDCSPATDNILVGPILIPTLPSDTICEGGSTIIELVPSDTLNFTYSWNFGSGATPSTGIGPGPHTVTYITTTDNQANGAVVWLTIGQPGCSEASGQVSHINILTPPDVSINGSTSNLCYYTNRTFQSGLPLIPGATYSWDFGTDAVPAVATGYGPHTVYYTSEGTKTVTLIIYPNAQGAQCPDSTSIQFMVIGCAANITGIVKSVTGAGIPGANVRLYSDDNTDGIADNDTIRKSVLSTSTGIFSMVGITPGNYVIVQIQPLDWLNVKDEDTSNDGDIVSNIDSLDNLIPATLLPSEIDANNNFVESPKPANISGYVFIDFNHDEIPDSMEGRSGITISLFHDNNIDGHADSQIPFASQISDSLGYFSFENMPVGNYVLAETQLLDFLSVKDIDASDDEDLVPNTDIHNDTIPVTLINDEHDDQNYFIDGLLHTLLVSNTNDSGYGSLHDAVLYAVDLDTIRFDTSLAGMMITIDSNKIVVQQSVIVLSDLNPRVTISSTVPGLFDISNNIVVEFFNVDLISGMAGNQGAIFNNFGHLIFHSVHLFRNPLLPAGQFLIYNSPGSQLELFGDCFLHWN